MHIYIYIYNCFHNTIIDYANRMLAILLQTYFINATFIFSFRFTLTIYLHYYITWDVTL